jgi:hypothetical protein
MNLSESLYVEGFCTYSTAPVKARVSFPIVCGQE